MVVVYYMLILHCHIAQNSSGVKLWWIDHFRVLVRKPGKFTTAFSYFSKSGIQQGKILANDIQFAKLFPCQNFAPHGNPLYH